MRITSACAVVLLLAACDTGHPTTQSGTLAVSADGSRLFVADADNNQLVVVDPQHRKIQQVVPTGREPSHVLVAADGRVYVSNRQDRSVSVIDAKQGRETQRIRVGSEPTGMAFAQDEHTLLVANTTSHSVSVIDLSALAVTSTINLQEEQDPNSLMVLPDGRVYVTHARSGRVTILERSIFEPVSTFPLEVQLPGPMVGKEATTPGQPITPVMDAAGRIFIAHAQSNVSPITTQPLFQPGAGATDGASYAGGSPANGGPDPFVHPPVVMPALATIDPRTDTILPATEAGPAPIDPSVKLVPPTILTVRDQALAGPSAAVVDPNGHCLYVAMMNSNNVALIALTEDPKVPQAPAQTLLGQNVSQIVGVGAGPTGLAIPPSADRVYVHNALDHSLSTLRFHGRTLVQEDVFSIGSSPLTPEQDLGRRLFFTASDNRLSSRAAGGIACASCHPGGREDGRTWQFTEGPRNTPTLAGRHLAATAPYHWDGGLSTMHDFNEVITKRMGGIGDGSQSMSSESSLTDLDFNAILAFLESLPAPDNPYRDTLDQKAVLRGKQVFEGAAGCAGCHAAESDFTDNAFHSVGTIGKNALGEAEAFPRLVNTPALHNLFATAPYLHDGSKATLRERIDDDANGLHGTTSGLSEREKQDLVQYLLTL